MGNFENESVLFNSLIRRSEEDFRAMMPDKPDQEGTSFLWPERPSNFDDNNDFIVDFSIPLGHHGKPRHLVIMVCGFGEGWKEEDVRAYNVKNTILYDNYIRSFLADFNVSAVLLPLPFHFSRNRVFDMSPGKRMTQFPPRFFLGYHQIVEDIFALKSYVENPHRSEWEALRNKFAKDLYISVFGFSLGGMATSACYFLDKKLPFFSYNVMASGFNFVRISEFLDNYKNIKPIFLKSFDREIRLNISILNNKILIGEKREWNGAMDYYDNADNIKLLEQAIERHKDSSLVSPPFLPNELYNTFRLLMLEEEEREAFEVNAKLSALIGGVDPLIPEQAKQLSQVFGTPERLEIMPSVGHFPHLTQPTVFVNKWREYFKKLFAEILEEQEAN